jgi:hypothetical protein
MDQDAAASSAAAATRKPRFVNGPTDTPMGERIGDDKRSGWIGPWSAWRRDIAAALLIGLLLGALGPFGSFLNGGPGLRLAYWVATSLMTLAIYGVGLRWALHEGQKRNQPDWFTLGVGVAILSLPFSLAVSALGTALWPDLRRHVHPVDWYWQALVINFPISLAWRWWGRRADGRRARPGADAPPLDAAARERETSLAPGAGVVCLQMEDHYVRVHAGGGSKLILSSLTDAIQAVGGVEGAQVHRSWWVARDQIVRPVWVGRNLHLELTNGLRAPVSRHRIAQLKAMGWLS